MAMKMLTASTATGAGLSVALRKGVQEHTVQVIITGSPTAVTVALESSLDNGVTWNSIGTYAFSAGDLTAASAMYHVVNKPAELVRMNTTVLTGGTAPTVTAYYLPFEHRGN